MNGRKRTRSRAAWALSGALLWLLAPASAWTQQTASPDALRLTLEEAVARARENNPMVRAARQEVEARRGQHREATSLFWPDLTFTENFSRTTNPVYVFMGKLTQERFGMMDFALPNLNRPAPLNNYQSRAELTVPLFAGGKLKAAYRATLLGVEAASSESAFAESSLTKAVTEAFLGSLLAARAAEVMAETVGTAEAHLRQVEAMHGQGLILDSDLLRMRVFVSDMRQQKAAREADARVARAYLAYALGYDGEVEPAGELSGPGEAGPLLEEAIQEAIAGRKDLRAAEIQSRQASEGVKMARADYLPQVGAMAAYEQDTEGWSGRGDNWMVGVQLRLPLFDGGARSGRLLTARAREFQAQQALLDLKRKVRVDVQEAWLRLEAASERVAVSSESEAQARENLRIVELRYKEGMASITDLLDADTALTASALQRAQAVHDQRVARARLQWAMGK
ncbi:MAG: TolC family protein [Acidobacteriota bacterium]